MADKIKGARWGLEGWRLGSWVKKSFFVAVLVLSHTLVCLTKKKQDSVRTSGNHRHCKLAFHCFWALTISSYGDKWLLHGQKYGIKVIYKLLRTHSLFSQKAMCILFASERDMKNMECSNAKKSFTTAPNCSAVRVMCVQAYCCWWAQHRQFLCPCPLVRRERFHMQSKHVISIWELSEHSGHTRLMTTSKQVR